MATENRLILKVEGPEKTEHHPDGYAFAEKIKQLLDFLKSSASESGQSDVAFLLVDLSHASPATVEFELVPKNGAKANVAINSIKRNLQRMHSNAFDEIPRPVLNTLAKFAKNSPEKIASTTVEVRGNATSKLQKYQFNGRLSPQVQEALKEKGFVETNMVGGLLDRISVHDGAHNFMLDTGLPVARKVTCKFDPKMLKKVQSALKRYVSVRGECFYRAGAAFPYKVNVTDMEILPPSETLPTLSDLRGIAPGGTGGKTPEQFVRELRDKQKDSLWRNP